MSWSAAFLLVSSPFFGSFVGLVVDRLPDGRSILTPRSACDHCRTPLGLRDLLPIVGWLWLRGRCRRCGEPIDPLYPTLEVAALAIAIWTVLVVPEWLAWPTVLLGFALLALMAIDFRHLILPDEITLPLIPLGLVIAWWVDVATVWNHAVAAVLGFVAMAGLRAAYRRLRKREGLGLGDAKLVAAAGAWVGIAGLPGVILIAAVFGLAFHFLRARFFDDDEAGSELAFGPWIAAGFWLTWLYGPLQLA